MDQHPFGSRITRIKGQHGLPITHPGNIRSGKIIALEQQRQPPHNRQRVGIDSGPHLLLVSWNRPHERTIEKPDGRSIDLIASAHRDDHEFNRTGGRDPHFPVADQYI